MREKSEPGDREFCRDVIERFLDRSWLNDGTPIGALTKHRIALNNLDAWLRKHRVVALTGASAQDVRALLNSPHWDAVALGCECLVSLVATFFQSLQETRFRSDDPIMTLIDQEMAVAAKRAFGRPAPRESRRARMGFHLSPAL